MRFIGWACAKSHLDEERMQEADELWREENRKKQRDAFLRANYHGVQQLAQQAELRRAPSGACDAFYQDFKKDSGGIHADLARYIRNGELFVYETPDGQALDHHRHSYSRRLGVLNGVEVLKKKPRLRDKLRTVDILLGEIAQDAQRATGGELNHMDDQRRDAVEIKIREAHKILGKVTAAIRSFQAFVAPRNIELLNLWCQHPGSDVSELGIQVALVGTRLDFAYRVRGNVCSTRITFRDDMTLPAPIVGALVTGDVE